jgi:hypothetical protein
MHGVHFMDFLLHMEEGGDRYDDWEIQDPEDWRLDNYNVLNSITVLLMQHQVQLPKWQCDSCGEDCRGRAKFLSYRGNGGIGVYIDDPCCSTCFNLIKWCNHCFSYVVPNESGACPNCSDPDSNHFGKEPRFSDPQDEAEGFGLTGTKFLGPDGDAEGLEGVSIVIMSKGG